jgi:hypothetical protein
MRKTALLLIFLFLGAFSAFGQDYDLSFSCEILNGSGNKLDTAHVNQSYALEINIFNRGADTYTGSVKFAVSTVPGTTYDGKSSTRYTHEKFILNTTPVTLTIPSGSSTTLTQTITFDPKNYYRDTSNIVIIWPNETIFDRDTAHNYAVTNVYVAFDGLLETGIQSQTLHSMLSGLYPNPAEGKTQLIFKESQKGSVTLTDLAGRAVRTYPINGEKNLVLDLHNSNGILPSGLYLLKITTANGQETQKLLIK